MVQQLDLQQAKKAISALFKYNKSKSESDMLNSEDETAIYVEIKTQKIMNKAQINKKKVVLPCNPYPEDVEVCYITKGKESDIEEKIKKGSITQIKKVLHYKDIGTTYKAYESKRKLADSYDLFFVDDNIVHLMPSLLGVKFFAKNKVPIIIKAKNSLKNQVENALKGTYVKLHNGLDTLVLIGNFGMSEADVLKNYEAAVPEIVNISAHNWDQVQILGIKSKGSPLLPIYTALPKEEEDKPSKKAAPAKKAASTKKAAKATPAAAKAESEEPVKKAAAAKKAAKVESAADKAESEEPVKKAAAKKVAAKKAATPAKKAAAAPAKKAAAAPAKKATAVAPAKKAETKKVTKKVSTRNKK